MKLWVMSVEPTCLAECWLVHYFVWRGCLTIQLFERWTKKNKNCLSLILTKRIVCVQYKYQRCRPFCGFWNYSVKLDTFLERSTFWILFFRDLPYWLWIFFVNSELPSINMMCLIKFSLDLNVYTYVWEWLF